MPVYRSVQWCTGGYAEPRGVRVAFIETNAGISQRNLHKESIWAHGNDASYRAVSATAWSPPKQSPMQIRCGGSKKNHLAAGKHEGRVAGCLRKGCLDVTRCPAKTDYLWGHGTSLDGRRRLIMTASGERQRETLCRRPRWRIPFSSLQLYIHKTTSRLRTIRVSGRSLPQRHLVIGLNVND